MGGFRYEKGADGIVIITMDMEGKVNTMGGTFDSDLKSTVERLEKEKNEIKGAIITSAKETFFAGADLKLFVSSFGKENAAKDLFNSIENTKALFRRLEKLGRPVVAAINGTALGGGFEICLSCHYRVALEKPKVKIGLPEASLGLLPGAGGTVRMIHLLGPKAAVPFILEAKQVPPSEALNFKIIDEIAQTPEEMIQKAKDWILKNPHAIQPWDRPEHKIPGGSFKEYLYSTPAMLFKRTWGAFPAQEAILEVAAQTLFIQFDAAQRVETRALTKLATSREAVNMITTFFIQMREYLADGGKLPSKGFESSFTTRLRDAYIHEGAEMLKEGINPVRIDRVARLAGFTAGPLELSQKNYKPEMKSDYQISDEEIKDRLLFIESLEAMRCLEEGVIKNERDANIESIYAIGYPPTTGGVIQNVKTYGQKKFLDRVLELEKKYGKRFSPPKILQEKAKQPFEGDGF